MERLVRGRRSVRQYTDENVDQDLLQSILSALGNAPTGVNLRELTFHVVDDRSVMQRFRDHALAALAREVEAGRVPERLGYLHAAVPAYFNHGVDLILRGAPHFIVISAPKDAACPHEDVTLALAYFELMAQSAGLGTVWCGMLKMLLETLPELKNDLGIPEDSAYYGMLFGRPAVQYPRTVQRDHCAKVRRIMF
jgi:nitroreductase